MVYNKISLVYFIPLVLIQTLSIPILGISLDAIEQQFAASPDKSPEDILDDLSDEELIELLKSTGLDEESSVPTTPPAMPQPKLTAPKVFEPISSKPTVPPTPAPSQSLEQITKAISIIENTLTLIEQFLLHTQYIPELPGKIASWVRQDKIREWQVDLTWDALRAKIESLYYKITLLKERDPVTKQYRHIDTLTKDTNAYNALVALQRTLHRSVLTLKNIDPFLPLSKKIRSEIREILGSFAEAIYTAQIEKKIEAVLEKYSGRATELKGEKEKAEKKAFEESKKVRKESKRKEVKASTPSSQSSGKISSDKYDIGAYDDYSYYPSYPSSYPSYPSSGSGSYYSSGSGNDYDYPSSSKASKPSSDKGVKKDQSVDSTSPKKETVTPPSTSPKKADKAPEKPADEKKASKDLEKILDTIDNVADSIGELVDQTGAGTTKRYIDIAAAQKQPNRSMMGSVEGAILNVNRARRLLKKIPSAEKDAALRAIKDRLKKTDLLELSNKVSSLTPTHNGIIALKNLGESIKALYQKNYIPQTIPLIETAAEPLDAEPMRKKSQATRKNPAPKPARQ